MSQSLATSIRTLLLASAAGLTLVACGGGTTSSPGNTNSVIVNPPTSGGGGVAADVNLVPGGSCTTGTALETIENAGATVRACVIQGTITTNLTLDANIGYALDGAVFVGQDGGANVQLTIPAGTTVFGKAGNDALFVTRGSRINAVGNANEPIIFTSIQDVQGTVNAETDRGLWGGLVLSGFAPINDCNDNNATGGTAQCVKSGEGGSGLFGGDQPGDSSGALSYVQVKYAGFKFNDEDELNGIAFQGVGSGTQCDHIQVHNNADDGVEFFGGTVECEYLVLTGIGDDSIDWTDGWQGKLQYALVLQADDDGDQGIEADNRGGDNDVTPRSNPSIANVTMIGQQDIGALFREGTAGNFCNFVVTGFGDGGLDLDNTATHNQANAGNLTVDSWLLDNATNVINEDAGFDAQAFYDARSNTVEGNNSLSAEGLPGTSELAVPACDLSIAPYGAFFDNVDYIGAFSDTDTTDSNWATGWTFNVFQDVTECPVGTFATGENLQGKDVCELAGRYTSNLRLNNNFHYQLDGAVFIGEDAGADATAPIAGARTAILTIDPGTTLFGASGNDFLSIQRGSQIRSNGTPTAPVVLTSRQDMLGTATASSRGQWGGLVINGRAPINDCNDNAATGGTADCVKSGEGGSGLFGGNTPEDNSGNLLYTRVQYAGFKFNDEDELNGIAFQGVGSGTLVDYIQVHNNADDGIEFFGGTVNAKHVLLTGNGDDSMDWTDGWTGKAQYVIISQASDDGDQGIEADNRGGDNDVTPRSAPKLSNFTLVGAQDIGMLLREGTAGEFYNGIITGFGDGGIDIDTTASAQQATNGALTFDSIYVVDNTPNLVTDNAAEDAALLAAFNGGSNNVDGDAQNPSQDSTLSAEFAPGANEQAVTPTDPSLVDPFFDSVAYVGAVENASDDWFKGWTLLPSTNGQAASNE